MKKLIPLVLLACALVVPTALNAATFEGKVRMKMTAGDAKKGEPMEMDYRIKEGFVRTDIQVKDKSGKPGMGMSTIIDSKKQEMIMLMPEQQMYMVTSFADKPGTAATRPGAPRDAAGKTPEAKIEKTGETETILGYKCEKYLLKEEKTTIAMWLTSDLGDFSGFGSTAASPLGARGAAAANSPQAQEWAKVLAGKSLFPLRVVGSNNADSKETFRMEVTAIEKQSLPASDFAAPAGWKKFEMPNMGDMMKGMIPGMGR